MTAIPAVSAHKLETLRIMTAVDSRTYLEDGGYLQKGRKVNLREVDLEKKVSDLLPSRYYPAVEETKHENNIIQMVSGREDISVGKTIIILNGSYPTKMKAHYKRHTPSILVNICLTQSLGIAMARGELHSTLPQPWRLSCPRGG